MHWADTKDEMLALVVQLAQEQGSEETPAKIRKEVEDDGIYILHKLSEWSICWGEIPVQANDLFKFKGDEKICLIVNVEDLTDRGNFERLAMTIMDLSTTVNDGWVGLQEIASCWHIDLEYVVSVANSAWAEGYIESDR